LTRLTWAGAHLPEYAEGYRSSALSMQLVHPVLVVDLSLGNFGSLPSFHCQSLRTCQTLPTDTSICDGHLVTTAAANAKRFSYLPVG